MKIKEIQNQSVTLLLQFIIELIQDNNCLSIHYTSFLNCFEIIIIDDVELMKHNTEIQTLFTIFSKANKAVVIKSFNLLKEFVELMEPKDIPLELIQQYVRQVHDINITLSAIQIYSDLILKLSNESTSYDIFLNILKQMYFCLKDERYDIWSGSLQSITQAFAWKGELIQTNVDTFLKTILFPIFSEMKRIYFRLTNTEVSLTKMAINLYLPLPLRQWNDNLCVLVGGLTRTLKYIIPFVSNELKEEMYDQFIELIQLSFCNAGLLICEVTMKYCNFLIQSSKDDIQIYDKIISMVVSIGELIQETNGVNATISENYLIAAKKIIETNKVESIITLVSKYVNVFPDDFAIHSSGLSVVHNYIFEILDYTLEHYENSELLYINCICSMMRNMNGEYQKRAQGCLNNCLVHFYN